jgi:hypothetical protein
LGEQVPEEDSGAETSDQMIPDSTAGFEVTDERAVAAIRQRRQSTAASERRQSAVAASRERQLSLLMPISASEGGLLADATRTFSRPSEGGDPGTSARARVLASIQSAGESGKRFMRGDKQSRTSGFRSISMSNPRRISIERRLFAISPHAMWSNRLDSDGKMDGKVGYGVRKRSRDPFMLRPNGKFKIGWDIVTIIWLGYLLISLPLYIGFEMENSPFQDAMEYMIFSFFSLDVVVNFRTGYFDSLGNLVVLNKPVAMRYLKGWFIVDVVSTIPIDWIDWGGGDGATSHGTQAFKTAKITKAIKVVRLLRLTKLMKSSVYADQFEEWLGVQKSRLNVARTLLMMVVLAHFVSCFWAFVGSINADSEMVWWDAYSQMLGGIEVRFDFYQAVPSGYQPGTNTVPTGSKWVPTGYQHGTDR